MLKIIRSINCNTTGPTSTIACVNAASLLGVVCTYPVNLVLNEFVELYLHTPDHLNNKQTQNINYAYSKSKISP